MIFLVSLLKEYLIEIVFKILELRLLQLSGADFTACILPITDIFTT